MALVKFNHKKAPMYITIEIKNGKPVVAKRDNLIPIVKGTHFGMDRISEEAFFAEYSTSKKLS